MVSALGDGSSLFGTVHDDVRCRIRIADVPEDALRVASFQAQERLSALFRYTVVVAVDPDAVPTLDDARGSDATFVVEREGAVERIAHGIVTEVIPDGAYVGKRQVRTTLVIEPRLAELRHTGGFRIFQNQSVKDVIEALLKPVKVDVAWRLKPAPPLREYRTQQNESTYAFIQRFAADEGLHFYFEHDDDKSTLVFTNNALGYTEMEGGATLDYRDAAGAVTGEHVVRITRSQRVRSGAVEHRDYDFRKPRIVLLGRAEVAEKGAANAVRREVRDYPGGFEDPDAEGTPRARMRLEELRSDAFTLHGSASCLRLQAGKQFTLQGHRDGGFNQKMLVTEVSFGAAIAGAFSEGADGPRGGRAAPSEVQFHAVPADTPLRPPRRAKPPSHLQIARVVGPKEGDPHVDEFGRVKVQFHWDRDGKFDAHSSCWMRMMTPIAHGDEGFWSAHKVGSEVLVDFVDGDVDRPMILGAVYNGREQQPYKQPSKVTRSTWKVRGIPGGTGFNEITFENQSGSEQIIVHAQRDMNETVLHNHHETIGANHSSSVGASQTVSVGASQTISVGKERTVTVDGGETIHVKKKRSETVDTGEDVTVSEGRTHTVKTGNESLTVSAGDRSVTVSKHDAFKSKSKADAVETTFDLNAGESITIHHQEDATLTIKAGEATLGTTKSIVLSNPSGTVTLSDGKVTLAAKDELVLGCGAAKISLKKDGTVAVSGSKEVGLACNASTLKLEPAKATINGAAANITASGMLELSGALIKIN
jgi:type VI secretion system secreted protein VgrG